MTLRLLPDALKENNYHDERVHAGQTTLMPTAGCTARRTVNDNHRSGVGVRR